MTPQQNKKVTMALEETRAALARATRYSPDLQNHNLVAYYERHIAKLTNALKTDVMPEFSPS